MDVRAVDTSALAARRVEMEHGQSKEKKPFVIGRITSGTSEDSSGQVSRAKSSTEEERGHGQDEHEKHAPHAQTPGSTEPSAPPTEHILDVKV